ncbi:MAG: CdaR family protein [Clostridia bacterium]|nr:CdaR family protein [Clostridia bacterium]
MMNGKPKKKSDGQRGPFKGLRRGIGNIVASRTFLRAASLLAAVVIWSVMVISDGTLTREKTFSNVAVSITGESALKSRGYIVMDDLTELLPAVRMKVEVTQANYNRASGTSYNPYIDLSKVTGVGENELTVSFSSQLYGPVLECEPSSVTVNVERYITRRIPVSVAQVGQAPEGLYLDTTRTDPTMLSVSGPESLVSRVARASAKLDLSALSLERASDKMALDIVLEDASGEEIHSDKLEVTNQTVITTSIVVETECVPMREIPLDAQAFVTGTPAEGFELVDVYLEEESLPVATAQEVLDAMTVLTTDQPLDITGAAGTVEGYVKLRRPSGIENTLPAEVAVTAKIEETSVERTFRSVEIEVEGLDTDRRATLSRNSVTVQLTGAYRFINGLTKDDLRLYVDVEGLEPGSYTLPVQIHIDNAPEFNCALSSPEITVTIREK